MRKTEKEIVNVKVISDGNKCCADSKIRNDYWVLLKKGI